MNSDKVAPAAPSPAFAALAESFAGVEDVLPPSAGSRRHFGCDALRVRGSIFAMEVTGRLVVKLPAPRVAALIAEGLGSPFGTTPARPMKEWVSLPLDAAEAGSLVREAYAFVGSARR